MEAERAAVERAAVEHAAVELAALSSDPMAVGAVAPSSKQQPHTEPPPPPPQPLTSGERPDALATEAEGREEGRTPAARDQTGDQMLPPIMLLVAAVVVVNGGVLGVCFVWRARARAGYQRTATMDASDVPHDVPSDALCLYHPSSSTPGREVHVLA